MSDLDHPVRRIVAVAAGIHIRTRRWVERRLKSHDLTYPQFGALTVLAARERLSQRGLADALETDTTTAMVVCDALERKGWLERRPDSTDRRTNRLVLTGRGKEVYEQARTTVDASFAVVAETLSAREARTALMSLAKLYERIREITSLGGGK
jgi:DNA-binding MarR family transcriptional regulator